MKTLVMLLLLIISSTNLFAGTRDPHTPDEKYIEYGSKFEYILNLCGVYEDNSMFCGSAVAINKNWILTAAHVVKNAKHCGIHIKDYEVILIDKIIPHQDFNGEFGIADIALCKLKTQLNLDFYPSLYENNDEINKLCCMAGYGLTGTFNTGQIISDNRRRAGSNFIDKIHKDLLICSPSKNHLDKKTALEFIICSGDSGGGLFIDGKLAGINSCVITDKKNGAPDSKYGTESGHTRVSKFLSWILENLKNNDK